MSATPDVSPAVSVIMPVYNAAATVAQAIESVLNQSSGDWELLVVDDGSSDASVSIVEGYVKADSRIQLVPCSVNSGGPATPRNLGLSKARGQWVAFLDADDGWLPQKLARQLSFMQEQKLDLCGTWVNVIDRDSKPIGLRQPPAQISFLTLLCYNPLVCSSVLVSKAAVQERKFLTIGHEDYALWLLLARDGVAMGVLPESLAEYRVHPGSVSANKWKVAPYFWHIYHKVLCYSRPRAAWFTLRYLTFALWRAIKSRLVRLEI